MSNGGVGYPVGKSANLLRRNRRREGKNNIQCTCYDAARLNKDLYSFQEFISSTACHAIFAFLDPLLIGVVQVKFQNTNYSPFQTRPATMWAFVLATFVYVFALAAAISMKGKTKSRLFGNFAFLAGSLSSVSLVSVLLPSLTGGVLFIIWAFLPVMVTRDLVKLPISCFQIYGRIKDTLCKILGMSDDSMEEQPEILSHV